MTYRKIVGIVIVSSIAVSLIGCGKGTGGTVAKQTGESYTEQIKISEQYDSVDKAMEGEVNNIKYDLRTIIDSSRGSDTIADYPLDIYIEPVEPVEPVETTEVHNEEKDDNTEVTPLEDYKIMEEFMKCTGTSKDDYEDYAVSFNKDKGYLVAVVKPVNSNKQEVESAVKNFIANEASNNADENIRNAYTNYKFTEHNGHFIIVVASDGENIKSSILAQMVYIDTIIGESVRNGYNQEIGQEVKEITEEEVEALSKENPSYSEVTQPDITGHVHEDGTYHEGEVDSEEQSTPITGHYHSDGEYHEGTH